MKRLGLFLYLGFIAALLSCTKESNPLPSDSGREVELTVRADMGQTRATEADFNDEVESMQVFVFSGGRLEAVGYSTASESVTLRCFEGTKNIYAVVNHPEIEWTPSMADEDLLETVVELKDNMNVMFGYAINRGLSADGTLWGTLPSTMMSINVKRVAARIVLRSVKNSTGGTLTVTRAYITNVVGDADFHAVYSSSDCTWEPAIWYNRMGIERGLDMGSDLGDLEGILCSEEMSVSVWKLKENINEYFYCFPNPTEKDYRLLYGMEGWCSRFTRLVVKAEYNDVPYYYVVSIGGIQNNHSYEVELEITGSGASDEEGGYKSDDDEGEGSGDDGDDESGDTGGSIGDGHFKDGDETGGGGGKGENSVSAGNCDGVAAIRFIGGCAEVREL